MNKINIVQVFILYFVFLDLRCEIGHENLRVV